MKDVETVSFFRKKIYHLVIHSHICHAMSGHEQNWNIVVGFERKRQCTPSGPHTSSDHQLMISYVDVLGRYVAIHKSQPQRRVAHRSYSSISLFFTHSLGPTRKNWARCACFSSYGIHGYMKLSFASPLVYYSFLLHSKQQNWRTFLQEWFSLEFIQV